MIYTTGIAALSAGLITGLHCIGMCGPLTCALCPKAAGSSRTLAIYHAARTLSYITIGAALGLMGGAIGFVFNTFPVQILSWGLFAFFLLLAAGGERWIPVPGPLRDAWRRIVCWGAVRPALGALFIGMATPLLPCGPLYLAFAVALTAGSLWHGAAVMAFFALGTISPLWLAQIGFIRLRTWAGRNHLATIQRSIALVAAGLVLWRILAGEPFTPGGEPVCPMCPRPS